MRNNMKTKDKDKLIKIYKNLQCSKKQYRNINFNLHPNEKSSLTRIKVGKDTKHLHPKTGKRFTIKGKQVVNSQQELEKEIINQNKKHFAQSKGSPFTVSPLDSICRNGYKVQSKDGTPLKLPPNTFAETFDIMEILCQKYNQELPPW